MTLTCLRCSCDKDVVVVTTDTDILVVSLMLLMFHWGKGMKIHMLSNTSSSKDVVKKNVENKGCGKGNWRYHHNCSFMLGLVAKYGQGKYTDKSNGN